MDDSSQTMNVQHIIDGKYHNGESFLSRSPFFDFNISLPRLNQDIVSDLYLAMQHTSIPSLSERKGFIDSLDNYQPSSEVVHAVTSMTGMPVSWVESAIEQGKSLAIGLLDLGSEKGATSYVGITPNDPREHFYFVAHALLAGSPMILKPSAREPVLCADIVTYLHDQGLPNGFLNVIYADTSSQQESRHIYDLAELVDIPIIMGTTQLLPDQITFNAEQSRGVVLDADFALPHLRASVESPQSCLAEHNYLVVGEENFERIVSALHSHYQQLRSGDLFDSQTTMGRTDPLTLENVTKLLRYGRNFDTMRLLSGDEELNKGAVVQHFPEDSFVGSNPLLVSPLPAYVTGVRLVDSIERAHKQLVLARNVIQEKYGVEKSMAIGIYGEQADMFKELFQNCAYSVSVNETPTRTNGVLHQGVHLHEVLRR